jgi:16S rRNA processing protein RimM
LTQNAAADRVVVGRVIGSFGLRGEAKVAASDIADFRPNLAVTALLADGSERGLAIQSIRKHKNRLLVRFAGFEGRDAIEALRGAALYAARADLPPLPPGTFRDEELIGMRVVDSRLGDLGVVCDVRHYPHADMLVVGERALLVPAIAAYGVVIDAASRTIASSLPDGFEDLIT